MSVRTLSYNSRFCFDSDQSDLLQLPPLEKVGEQSRYVSRIRNGDE